MSTQIKDLITAEQLKSVASNICEKTNGIFVTKSEYEKGIKKVTDTISEDIGSLSTVASSGSYNDLSNGPTFENIPLSGNITASDLGLAKASDLSSVATSGNYTDLNNTPYIPVKASDLTNDINFVTSSDLPTNVSDLTNDAGFITNAVDDLTNYYLKTETYTKDEIDTIAGTINNLKFEVVEELPTEDIKTNVIYLIPSSTSQNNNIKDEYINLDGTVNGWEKIGNTEIDLSDYATTTVINTALADYTTTADLTTLLTGYAETSDIPTKLSDLTDDTNISSPANGQVLTYNSSTDKWQNSNPANSGHIIKNSTGTSLTQRTNLKFINAIIEDDSANDTTIVTVEVGNIDVVGASARKIGNTTTLRWTDPSNSGDEFVWAGTKVVRKVGSAPQSDSDGTVVVNSTTRNAYSQNGYEDNNLEFNTVYYYRFFPYTTNKVIAGTTLIVDTTVTVVTIPTQTIPMYYNEALQIPTLTPNVGYIRSGDTSGTISGTYNIVAALPNTEDYIWSDGTVTDKIVEWTINKSQAVVHPSESSFGIFSTMIDGKTITFPDLYGRTITSATSADTDTATVTTDGTTITVFPGTEDGITTITVTTNSTEYTEAASCTISVELIVGHIYGFHIDSNEADPSTRVTYIEEAVGKTPAYMDFSNDTFNYGSWGNAFFMPRPCMLKFDGTVDYYLDPNDYSKKDDGINPSDIANSEYEGNVMLEFGKKGQKIWMKIVPDSDDSTSGSVYIANYQVDPNYHDWCFHDCDGNSGDHFYIAAYSSEVTINNEARSLSGYTYRGSSGDYPSTVITRVRALNSHIADDKRIWEQFSWSYYTLINMMCILISKSTNTRAKFGCPRYAHAGGYPNSTTGIFNNKGLFYGKRSDDFNNDTKIFGLENLYGGKGTLLLGIMTGNNWEKSGHRSILVKLTQGTEDGSTISGFVVGDNRSNINVRNSFIDNYIHTNLNVDSNMPGRYLKRVKFTQWGLFPFNNENGTNNTYYCDDVRQLLTPTYWMLCYTGWYGQRYTGMFSTYPIDDLHWSGFNAFASGRLVCVPLANTEEEE